MDTQRIESFKQFAQYLEYPMVVFEADSGDVLDINYEAEVLLGAKVRNIKIEPGRTFTKNSFWDVLHGKKSLIWHRVRMLADGKEYLVSGLINEMTEGGTLIYTLLFERRADLNIGSLTLENIVNHAGIVAIHMGRDEADAPFRVEYISQNVNQYGYTRGQLYDKAIGLHEIVCTEDYERIRSSIWESAKLRVKEDSLECRVLTEERELIPVRLLIRYLYNDYGNLMDIEMLVMDLREEYDRNRENGYLSNAVTKMKNVVIVKSYQAGKRILRYISPNANIIGMNVEALKKGYKLTEDYIHPEDRDNVLDAIYQAVANGVTDYMQIYRMVTDDGKQIWVENEVTVNRVSDGEAEISFLITDITEQKNMEQEMAATLEVVKEPVESSEEPKKNAANVPSKMTLNDKDVLVEFQIMQDAISKNADYYTVVLNAQGKPLTTPAGPVCDMGLFYDLVERPLLKEKFLAVEEEIKQEKKPVAISFDMDNLTIHATFAPLTVEDKVMAYWMMTSFVKDGDVALSEVAENQWHLANSIVKCFYSQELVQKEQKLRKLTEMQLHKEQAERRVIEDIVSSMKKDTDAALHEICHKAGVYLSINSIAIYYEDKETKGANTFFVWNQSGEDVPFFKTMELSTAELSVLKEHFAADKLLIADAQSDAPFLKEMAKQTNMAVLVHKIEGTAGTIGYVAFADEDKNRLYDNVDIHFAKTVAKIFEGYLASREGQAAPDVVKSGMLESYDHIRDAVYVKDNRTGEIVFANKAADKLFGYSIVGMRATDIMNDQMEQYRSIGGVRRRFIDNRKVTKWQTYMKELDQIMNIVEVRLETLYGTDLSLIILKKNKNKG